MSPQKARASINFHQISRNTGERIRHQKVLESAAENNEATTVVEKDEIVKGYEYQKGQYVIIESANSKTCASLRNTPSQFRNSSTPRI